MLAGTFFTAISQVLLKQSANKKYSNPLLEYLNWRVIVAYGIFFGVLLLNTWCYTKVDMPFGPVIDTAAYVFDSDLFKSDPERKDQQKENLWETC